MQTEFGNTTTVRALALTDDARLLACVDGALLVIENATARTLFASSSASSSNELAVCDCVGMAPLRQRAGRAPKRIVFRAAPLPNSSLVVVGGALNNTGLLQLFDASSSNASVLATFALAAGACRLGSMFFV